MQVNLRYPPPPHGGLRPPYGLGFAFGRVCVRGAIKPTNREVFDYPCNRNELATFLRARGWRVRSGSGAGFLDDSQLLSNLYRHFNKLGKKFSASKWNGPFLASVSNGFGLLISLLLRSRYDCSSGNF